MPVVSHPPILAVASLKVTFKSRRHGPLAAIRDLNLHLAQGEVLGLVGESGSGKSVACLAVMRLLPPDAAISGRVLLEGTDLLRLSEADMERIRGARLAMIFQDPMSALNPVHTIGWQIMEALRLHRRLTGAAARRQALALLHHVGISAPEHRIRDYPHQLSGGLCQRVMIAMALAAQPAVLIADEPTTALDVTIQAQILSLIKRLAAEVGTSVILITHDLGVVAENCDRMAVMYGGRVVESGTVEAIFQDPQHPYTRGLLASLPSIETVHARLSPISGSVPPLPDLPAGCPFCTRCGLAIDACRMRPPPLRTLPVGGRSLACHVVG